KTVFSKCKTDRSKKGMGSLTTFTSLAKMWYQPEVYDDIPLDRMLFTEGDILLGPGVAIMWTPGHSQGNQSLVVNTETGIWVSSENAIAAECMVPEHSKIPGLKKYAQHTPFEVVMNGNTLEDTSRQYNSLIQEKLMADPSQKDPRFPQFFPSSELTPSKLSIGANPSFMHKKVALGKIRRPERGQS